MHLYHLQKISMSDLASKLIAENKTAHARGDESAKSIDLGNCGLTELPEALFNCVWIEELVVSNRYWDNTNSKWIASKNQGKENAIITPILHIKSLKNLKKLVLCGNPDGAWSIEEISELFHLTKLHTLNLSNNKIKDISSLRNLNELHTLDLSVNKINDISILKTLTNLRSIKLSSNNITDLSILKHLIHLETINLTNNNISAHFLIKNPDEIYSIYITNNQIVKYSYCSKPTEYIWLDLSNISPSHLSEFKIMTSLKLLLLSKNKISDFSFLSQLKNLEILDLTFNIFTNLDFLESLSRLKSLTLTGNEISDLHSLSKLTNLEKIDLRSNQISEIEFLGPLINLKSLILSDNQIANISILKKLTNLEQLDLRSNQVINIGYLKSLTRLHCLHLSNNKIADISVLINLTELQKLDLENNQISEIDSLENSRKLRIIKLSNNKISDISVIKHLINITILELKNNKISGFHFIKDPAQVDSIYLHNSQISKYSLIDDPTKQIALDLNFIRISDCPYFENLHELHTLELGGNNISDYSFLTKFTHLNTLSISNAQALDYNLVRNITQLKSLNLSNNDLFEIDFIRNLTQLVQLTLSNNYISDISVLQNLTDLKSLDLSKNNITEIDVLQHLVLLNNLNLSQNKIENVSPLESLIHLKTLSISNTHISNFSSLRSLDKLNSLALNNNHISDIHFLTNLLNLERLNLNSNAISDISSVSNLRKIEYLNLNDNHVSDISYLQNLIQLRELKLGCNEIEDISILQNLTLLESLDLSDNRISGEFFFENPKEISRLYLSSHKIEYDTLSNRYRSLYEYSYTIHLDRIETSRIPILRKLTKLKAITIRSNKFTNYSFLEYFSNLKELWLTYVVDINIFLSFQNLLKSATFQSLYLDDSPLIKKLGLESEHSINHKQAILNEVLKLGEYALTLPAKIVLLGNHGSGKSSLLHYIIHDELAPDQVSTHVLNVQQYRFGDHNNDDLPDAVFFDFGGQDYYHGIYRVFLSTGSLQLLVWNISNDQNGTKSDCYGAEIRNFNLEYWVGQKIYLESTRFTGNKNDTKNETLGISKQDEIIMIQTHSDTDKKVIKYSQELADLFGVSDQLFMCLKKTISSKLNGEVKKHQELEHAVFKSILHSAISRNKRTIHVRNWYADFLKNIARESETATYEPHSIDDLTSKYRDEAPDIFSWKSEFERLHQQGIVLYYGDDFPDKVWLNPTSIIKYIHSEVLRRDWLDKEEGKVLKINFNAHQEIIRLLELQKVIFLDTENPEGEQYIIPNYLKLAADDTDFIWFEDGVNELGFVLKFESFIPFGLINLLICSFGELSKRKKFWRNQLIFSFNHKKIFIHLDFDNLEISLRSSKILSMLEKRYFFYAIMALYWDEKPLGFEQFRALIDDEIVAKPQLVSAYRTPRDMYVSLNGIDYINLRVLKSEVERTNDFTEATGYRLKEDKLTIDLFKTCKIPIHSLQPFVMKKIETLKKIFISYSHDDLPFRQNVQQFLINLEREKKIEIWHDGFIKAGVIWDEEIRQRLEQSDIVILLVSQNFIASTYVFEVEMARSIRKAIENRAVIIPFLLKNCDWKEWKIYPERMSNGMDDTEFIKISQFQFLPRNESDDRLKPLSNWAYPEDAWMQLVREIRGTILTK